MKSTRLFHLIGIAEAGVLLKREGTWSPPSLATEGFVHLSFAHQVAGTLDAHYGDTPEVVLVELGQASTADDLRLEVSRGGSRFPHLYRPLQRTDVLRSWRLNRGLRGWHSPLFAVTPAGDDPQGLSH
ncbi:MAG: hypothetical protein ACI8QZ_003027 [Chlamydiales bacterium]|jgi:uncharacterized protein (DUF952 family)